MVGTIRQGAIGTRSDRLLPDLWTRQPLLRIDPDVGITVADVERCITILTGGDTILRQRQEQKERTWVAAES
jgi:hypothetical protein